MKIFFGFIFTLFIYSANASTADCIINEDKYSDRIDFVDEGYGNLIITGPMELESKPFQTMYLTVSDNAADKTRIQAELKSKKKNGIVFAHINVGNQKKLNIHVTVYYESSEHSCPTIVRKWL